MQEKIDFVILWVDGSDPKWLKEKNKYGEKKIDIDDEINRYRDMKTLKYWFRSVEKNTPWVNKIHFITWGHLPDFLNVNHPKLNIVNHKNFIPIEYLPTFNSNTIELNLHRIKDLSEKFILFNDDMYILNPLNKEYFFKEGLPCDAWRENCFKTEDAGDNFFDHIILNNLFVINKNFNKKEVVKNNFKKIFNIKYGKRNIRNLMLQRWNYFCGFETNHTANPFLKSSFKKLWDMEYDILNRTCLSKFRSVFDINQWTITDLQLVEGKFSIKSVNNFGRYYSLSNNNKELHNYILDNNSSIVCINDTNKNIDYEKATGELIKIFEKKFPDKSSFEK